MTYYELIRSSLLEEAERLRIPPALAKAVLSALAEHENDVHPPGP